jgi:hypothetical protein
MDAHTLKDVTPTHNETIRVIADLPALLKRDALFVRELLDGVGLAHCAGFVAFDAVAGEEDSVA